MDFTLNWVNGAKRKSITSNELNSRIFNRKKTDNNLRFVSTVHPWIYCVQWTSGINNARKIDVNDQNIHLT